MKKIAWFLAAIVLVVLFPELPKVLTEIAAAVAVWAAGDRLLVGLALGALAIPHLPRGIRRIKY